MTVTPELIPGTAVPAPINPKTMYYTFSSIEGGVHFFELDEETGEFTLRDDQFTYGDLRALRNEWGKVQWSHGTVAVLLADRGYMPQRLDNAIPDFFIERSPGDFELPDGTRLQRYRNGWWVREVGKETGRGPWGDAVHYAPFLACALAWARKKWAPLMKSALTRGDGSRYSAPTGQGSK